MSSKGATAAQEREKPARTRRSARRNDGKERTLPGYVTVQGDQATPVVLVQDELSFFEKNDFLGMLAGAVDEMLEQGLDFGALVKSMDLPDDVIDKVRSGDMKMSELGLTKVLPMLLTKLFRAVPRLMEDSALLSLGVPYESWDRVRPFLRQVDSETGFDIIETFVSQNARTLGDFFGRWQETIEKAISTVGTTSGD